MEFANKYTVMALARKMWFPILVLMPATVARRRIIRQASYCERDPADE